MDLGKEDAMRHLRSGNAVASIPGMIGGLGSAEGDPAEGAGVR